MIGQHYDEHPERGRHPLPLVEVLRGAEAQRVREHREEAVAWYRRLWRTGRKDAA